MPLSSSSEHWIRQDALTIDLNFFGDPAYLQASVLAGSVVMAYSPGTISFNAAHNFRTWPLEAADTHLETTSAYYVYARLTREETNARALVIYDREQRGLAGEIIPADGASGEPSPDYFYVYLGKISSSLDENGNSIDRYWEDPFRSGTLNTNQFQMEDQQGEWTKMFRLNKVSDLIEVLKTISEATINKLTVAKEFILGDFP